MLDAVAAWLTGAHKKCDLSMKVVHIQDFERPDAQGIFAKPLLDGDQSNVRIIRLAPGQALPPHRRSSGRTTAGQYEVEFDDLANLAAACAHCNRFKGDHQVGPSPLFGGEHRLFNPRTDRWDAHFAWSADYRRILPLDSGGDTTIQRLTVTEP
jgi:hypothetical protein